MCRRRISWHQLKCRPRVSWHQLKWRPRISWRQLEYRSSISRHQLKCRPSSSWHQLVCRRRISSVWHQLKCRPSVSWHHLKFILSISWHQLKCRPSIGGHQLKYKCSSWTHTKRSETDLRDSLRTLFVELMLYCFDEEHSRTSRIKLNWCPETFTLRQDILQNVSLIGPTSIHFAVYLSVFSH